MKMGRGAGEQGSRGAEEQRSRGEIAVSFSPLLVCLLCPMTNDE
ncbi:MAG: hypothetical protein V7K61_06650 [Nostoc sp.]